MSKTLFIAIGAGLAAALLYLAPLSSGFGAGLVLALAAPLPLAIIGFGWGRAAFLIASLSALLVLGIGISPTMALIFGLAQVAPFYWLIKRAMLSRPRSDGKVDLNTGTPLLEWFPAGNLLAEIALLGMLTTLASMIVMAVATGHNPLDFRKAIEAALAPVFTSSGLLNQLPPNADKAQFFAFVSFLLPFASSAIWVLSSVMNLAVAAIIADRSGMLARPMPVLSESEVPTYMVPIAGIALALTAINAGALSNIALVVTGASFAMYLLIGFAIAHVLTRGQGARTFVLTFIYFIAFVIPGASMFLAAAGLGETFMKLRRRFLHGEPPRDPPPPSLRLD